MTSLRCFIGWHAWDVSVNPATQDTIRCCRRCAVRERLEADCGGWTSGLWVRIDKDR